MQFPELTLILSRAKNSWTISKCPRSAAIKSVDQPFWSFEFTLISSHAKNSGTISKSPHSVANKSGGRIQPFKFTSILFRAKTVQQFLNALVRRQVRAEIGHFDRIETTAPSVSRSRLHPYHMKKMNKWSKSKITVSFEARAYKIKWHTFIHANYNTGDWANPTRG